jgi:hypothetical protein
MCFGLHSERMTSSAADKACGKPRLRRSSIIGSVHVIERWNQRLELRMVERNGAGRQCAAKAPIQSPLDSVVKTYLPRWFLEPRPEIIEEPH